MPALMWLPLISFALGVLVLGHIVIRPLHQPKKSKE